jgi:hypothetical protein
MLVITLQGHEMRGPLPLLSSPECECPADEHTPPDQPSISMLF